MKVVCTCGNDKFIKTTHGGIAEADILVCVRCSKAHIFVCQNQFKKLLKKDINSYYTDSEGNLIKKVR